MPTDHDYDNDADDDNDKEEEDAYEHHWLQSRRNIRNTGHDSLLTSGHWNQLKKVNNTCRFLRIFVESVVGYLQKSILWRKRRGVGAGGEFPTFQPNIELAPDYKTNKCENLNILIPTSFSWQFINNLKFQKSQNYSSFDFLHVLFS